MPGEKPVKLYDSLGLYLHITPNGHKGWRWKYRFAGNELRGQYTRITGTVYSIPALAHSVRSMANSANFKARSTNYGDSILNSRASAFCSIHG